MQLRGPLFWTVCIPLRTYLTLAAKNSLRSRKALRVYALVIAYRWLRGLEASNKGMLGGPAWWADSRPTHGQLWLAFALSGNWRFLAVDTAVGAANWWIVGPGKAILPILPPPEVGSDELPDGLNVSCVAGEEEHQLLSTPSESD